MAFSTPLLIVFSIVLIVLAVLRYLDQSEKRKVDGVVIGLVVASILIHVIPLEKLTAVKGVGIEISLEKPEIKAAINTLNTEQIKNKELRRELERLNKDLSVIRGSRVLWIDNSPSAIVSAKRLFRALGVDVVTATSSQMADNALCIDKDFDLIITDTQRPGNSYKYNDGIPIHEGANYIAKLRDTGDDIVKRIPVIFYSAYDFDRLVAFTKPARSTEPTPEISSSINDLIVKVIKRLSNERRKPIIYANQKRPTPVEGDPLCQQSAPQPTE